jgi:hypothetical protein
MTFEDDMPHGPLSFTRHFVNDDDSFCWNPSSITGGFSDTIGSVSRYPFKRNILDYHKTIIATMGEKEMSKTYSAETSIRVETYRPSFSVLFSLVLATSSIWLADALTRYPAQSWKCSQHLHNSLLLQAKRSKNRVDQDDLNRWYDDVDENATPDKVFWEEMERQRLLNRVNDGSEEIQQPSSTIMGAAAEISSSSSPNTRSNYNVPPPMSGFGGMYGPGAAAAFSGSSVASGAGMNGSPTTSFNIFDNMSPPQQKQSWRQPVPTMEQIKMAEATLAQYELFQVADNWIDEDLQKEMDILQPKTEDDEDAKGREIGETTSDSDITSSRSVGQQETPLPKESPILLDDEPWDLYDSGVDVISFHDDERRNVWRFPPPPKGS